MQGLRVDSEVARELNRATVFDLVRGRRVVSRAGLARETGLSKATISEIVDEFIQEGFIRTLGPGESSGGRRPVLLEFDPHARFAIGVELGDAGCLAVLTDLNAHPVRTLTTTARAASGDEAVVAAIPLVAELRAGIPAGNLLGIGVGTPGLVEFQTGILRTAPDLGWRDVSVGPPLVARFSVPVAVVNRGKAAALAEAWCGTGRAVDNLVYVSISTGITAGIVIGGHLYRGVTQSEGAVGHTIVLPDGPLCSCGNRGCLQAVAGAPAILSRIREELRAGRPGLLAEFAEGKLDLLTLEQVGGAAARDDPLVLGVLGEIAQHLGIAATNLVNILNPRVLIFGGPVIRAIPALVPLVRSEVRRRALSVSAGALEVVPSQLGRDAIPIGAAAFLLSQVSVVGPGASFPSPSPRPGPGPV
ncbi:MAG: ROK family transcriptional regulator [Chloroflexi bacterium]|nr:ROK family transcriptional regulator [Chloroflexota bacterium]